jgi:hypothetical protein
VGTVSDGLLSDASEKKNIFIHHLHIKYHLKKDFFLLKSKDNYSLYEEKIFMRKLKFTSFYHDILLRKRANNYFILFMLNFRMFMFPAKIAHFMILKKLFSFIYEGVKIEKTGTIFDL